MESRRASRPDPRASTAHRYRSPSSKSWQRSPPSSGRKFASGSQRSSPFYRVTPYRMPSERRARVLPSAPGSSVCGKQVSLRFSSSTRPGRAVSDRDINGNVTQHDAPTKARQTPFDRQRVSRGLPDPEYHLACIRRRCANGRGGIVGPASKQTMINVCQCGTRTLRPSTARGTAWRGRQVSERLSCLRRVAWGFSSR